jgi:hypothetical protein
LTEEPCQILGRDQEIDERLVQGQRWEREMQQVQREMHEPGMQQVQRVQREMHELGMQQVQRVQREIHEPGMQQVQGQVQGQVQRVQRVQQVQREMHELGMQRVQGRVQGEMQQDQQKRVGVRPLSPLDPQLPASSRRTSPLQPRYRS